jgi:Uri superfamily endonuclease
MFDLPNSPGTYILWLRLDRAATVLVGKLGTFDLAAGLHAYVGSARGPGGLRARVARHLLTDKTQHWHIDALTAITPAVAVWFDTSPERRECAWGQVLAALPGVTLPIPHFGSSDCACRAHLFAVPDALLPKVWQALHCPAVVPDAHYT